jgi:hypothetical protein
VRDGRARTASGDREELGLPPKAFARVLRFERAAAELSRDSGARFAQIAHAASYYDQGSSEPRFPGICRLFAHQLRGPAAADRGGVAADEHVPFGQDSGALAA